VPRLPLPVDSVNLHHHDVEPGQVRAHPLLHARSRLRHAGARQRKHRPREAAPRDGIPRETLISIRLIAHLLSQSSATARSQLGNTNSWPARSRTRGRSTATLPAPAVATPSFAADVASPTGLLRDLFQHQAKRFDAATRQNRSKLADTSSQALPTTPVSVRAEAIDVVLTLFMALRCFPFVESAPRAYRLKASNAAPPNFKIRRGNPSSYGNGLVCREPTTKAVLVLS
jgi:hypothetical protein